MKLRRLSTRDAGFETEFGRLVAVDSAIDKGIERAAEAIVDDVRARGDAAVLEYTNRFDRMAVASVADLEISQAEMSEAFEGLPPSSATHCGPPRTASASSIASSTGA